MQIKKRFIRITALLLVMSMLLMAAGCASSAANAPEEDTDTASADAASGDSTASDEPSIATTSVAVLEILDALEYDNVIGIPESEAEIPDRYEGLTTIGAPMTPDIEIVASLDPDYIISPKTLEEDLSSEYSTAGISSIFLDLSSVDAMYTAVNSLGSLLDREEQAAAMQAEYEEYMENYYAEKEDGPSVLILMCYPDGFFLVVTEDAYVGNLLEMAGGQNVYAGEESSGFLSINPEDMVQKDPDKIFVYAHYSEEAAFEYMAEEFETNSGWSYFSAVQNDEIYYLPSEYFNMSANLSWTESLDYLEPLLYGEE